MGTLPHPQGILKELVLVHIFVIHKLNVIQFIQFLRALSLDRVTNCLRLPFQKVINKCNILLHVH